MSVLDNVWHLYIGQSWLGTLTPFEVGGDWIVAEFAQGDAWGNFAPWFVTAAKAFEVGDEEGWQTVYGQLAAMGIALVSDDGETLDSPTVITDGATAWFVA